MGFLVCEDGMDVDQDPGLRSLLDLARENLALKQQLKSANHELSRLQVLCGEQCSSPLIPTAMICASIRLTCILTPAATTGRGPKAPERAPPPQAKAGPPHPAAATAAELPLLARQRTALDFSVGQPRGLTRRRCAGSAAGARVAVAVLDRGGAP